MIKTNLLDEEEIINNDGLNELPSAERPIDRFYSTARDSFDPTKPSGNEHFYKHKAAKALLRGRKVVIDAVEKEAPIIKRSMTSVYAFGNNRSAGIEEVTGVQTAGSDYQNIYALLSDYTRKYIKTNLHTPFMLQSIYLDELAGYTLERDENGEITHVKVNRFWIGSSQNKTYINSTFGSIDTNGEFTFLSDIKISAGDSGLVNPDATGTHIAYENGEHVPYESVKLYSTYEANYNYWLKFRNRYGYGTVDNRCGSVVFDALLFAMFATPSFGRIAQSQFDENTGEAGNTHRLSSVVASLLAKIMTDCWSRITIEFPQGSINTEVTLTVDDAVALVLAWFAISTCEGVSLTNLFTLTGGNSVEVIMGEDPAVELSSLTMLMPSNLIEIKPKYRKYKNAFIKIQTSLPTVSFGGGSCVKLRSETEHGAAIYAKLDADGYITAYVEDILDFTDLTDANEVNFGNVHALSKVFEYKENPVQIVIDGYVVGSNTICDNASQIPSIVITHKLTMPTSYEIKTGVPKTSSDSVNVKSSFQVEMNLKDNIYVRGFNTNMPIIENRSTFGWCPDLTDGEGRGIHFNADGVYIDKYADGYEFMIGGQRTTHQRQCVQYLGQIGVGLKLADADVSDFNVHSLGNVGDGSLESTNMRLIALTDAQVNKAYSADTGRTYYWPKGTPVNLSGYIRLSDAEDPAAFKTWLQGFVDAEGNIKPMHFFLVIFSFTRDNQANISSLPGHFSSYTFIRGIQDGEVSSDYDHAYAVSDDGFVYDNWMDPADGRNHWRRSRSVSMSSYYYFSGDGDSTYYKFNQDFDGMYIATPTVLTGEGAYDQVFFNVSIAAKQPRLLLNSALDVLDRKEKALIGDADYPTALVPGSFNDEESLTEYNYATQLFSNTLASVLNESSLRSFTSLRVSKLILAKILLKLQEQYSDPIDDDGNIRVGHFGLVADSYILRELIKNSKEKRSLRTFNLFKALFDALTVDPAESAGEGGSGLRKNKSRSVVKPLDDLWVDVDDDFGIDLPEFSDYMRLTDDGRRQVKFTKLFENVNAANLPLAADLRSKLNPAQLTEYSDYSLNEILSRYIELSDYADTEEKLAEVKDEMDVALAYITNAKEQLMNEYANLSADTTIMNLETALDAVEDTLTDASENADVILEQTISDIKNGVINQFNDGLNTATANVNDHLASFLGECDALQGRIAEKVKSEAEKTAINAKKFYSERLAALKKEADDRSLSFSMDSLISSVTQHLGGVTEFLGKATGMISGNNSYLGWQDSASFTPTSTLAAVTGAAKSGLEAAVSTAYHLVSKAVSALGDKIRKFMTETWKDGVSYHIRNSGFNTLGLQAATFIVDKSEFSKTSSNWYWLGKYILPKLDGTNSYYFTAQIGPCLVFFQDYSTDQLIITLNPILIQKDDLYKKNDYFMAEAEADSVRYTLTFLNEFQRYLMSPEIGILQYATIFNVPSRTELLADILSKAKAKSAAATWGLKGLILGLGIAAGVLLCCTGYGSVAGVALIAGATTVGMSCTGDPVDQSKIERLREDSTYANGVIMSADLASIWTSFIPTSAVKLCVNILALFSNVEYEFAGHTYIGTLCHAGDGLIVDIKETLGIDTTIDDEEFNYLDYIPLIPYAGTPTFKYTLVTDRERFVKQSAMMLGTVVAVGSLAVVAIKSGINQHKRKQIAKAQAEQWAGVKPKAEDYKKACKDKNGNPILDENGNPVMVADPDAFKQACSNWNTNYKFQLKKQKKINRWSRTVDSGSGGSGSSGTSTIYNMVENVATPADEQPIQYVIKRMG